MSEWWLLNEPTQNRIADFLDAASDRVIDNFNAHGNENSLTAALGQELRGKVLSLGDTTVTFDYRNFLEQQEEPLTGADGGFFVRIANGDEVVEKGVFYQAKRFPDWLPTRSLKLNRKEATRLRQQAKDMLRHTEDSILLGQTVREFYAVDAGPLAGESIESLQLPFRQVRLVTLGTYLGKWVARCTRGDTRKSFIEGIRRPQGFLKYLIEMDIKTNQRPLLTDGRNPIDINSIPGDQIPEPRWRRKQR